MTRDEALVLYNAGSAAVVETLCNLSQTIDAQQKRIKDLQIKIAKLSKDSTTSSKRPSSDDITKPKPAKKDSEKGKRKIGGQPGHPRNVRPPFSEDEIDFTHPYILTNCPECGDQVDLLDMPPPHHSANGVDRGSHNQRRTSLLSGMV